MSQSIRHRNNVKIVGHGQRNLLFAHGFGCDQNMWRFITPAFEQDYRIILFDYVGSGKSDVNAYDPSRYSNLQGYVQDIMEICTELSLTDVVFIGHSVSSMIGLLASIEAPDLFENLIIIGPSPCYVDDLDYVGGFKRQDKPRSR